MEINWRNITLAFFLAIYSFTVFGTNVTISRDAKEMKTSSSESTQFVELSKIVFPQTIHVDGNGISVIIADNTSENETNKVFLSTQYLCKLMFQYSVNYFREIQFFNLQFSAVDIIFPFHHFW